MRFSILFPFLLSPIIQILFIPNVVAIDPDPNLAENASPDPDASSTPNPRSAKVIIGGFDGGKTIEVFGLSDFSTKTKKDFGLVKVVRKRSAVVESGENRGTEAKDQSSDGFLDRILGEDQEKDNSMDKEMEGNQEQQRMDEPIKEGMNGFGQGELLNGNIRLDVENKNEETGPPPKFAYNWTDGKELTEEEAKNVPLIVTFKEKNLKYQASVEGSTIPVKIGYKPGQCSADDPKNVNFFQMEICKEGDEGKCDDGFLMCYVGKMDRKNGFPNQFALANTNELADQCKKEMKVNAEWKKEWEGKELHAVKVHIKKDGKFELAASYKNETITLMPMDGKCVKLFLGTKDDWLGTFEDAEWNKYDQKENNKNILVGLMNGVSLRQYPFLNVLPMDLLNRFQENNGLMAFIASKSCDMSILISPGNDEDGSYMKQCTSQKCDRQVHVTPGEIKEAMYSRESDNLHPILSPEDLPSQYKPYVEFYNPGDRNMARISSQGEQEIFFAIATIGPINPEMVIFRPAGAMYCTKKYEPDENEFVLSINKRTDCFGRFAWGERAIFYKDEMNTQNRLVTTRDMPLFFNGTNNNEFWTKDQFGDDAIFGTATCSLVCQPILKPYPGIEEYDHLCFFTINPTKGMNTPRAKMSQCKIGIEFNVDKYTLLLPFIITKEEQQKPEDNNQELEEEKPEAN